MGGYDISGSCLTHCARTWGGESMQQQDAAAAAHRLYCSGNDPRDTRANRHQRCCQCLLRTDSKMISTEDPCPRRCEKTEPESERLVCGMSSRNGASRGLSSSFQSSTCRAAGTNTEEGVVLAVLLRSGAPAHQAQRTCAWYPSAFVIEILFCKSPASITPCER